MIKVLRNFFSFSLIALVSTFNLQARPLRNYFSFSLFLLFSNNV